jgi:hypothetical protein
MSERTLFQTHCRYIHDKISVLRVWRIRAETNNIVVHTHSEIIEPFNSGHYLPRPRRIDNGKEIPLPCRNGITYPQVVGAEDFTLSPLTIIFTGKRIYKSLHFNTVVHVKTFRMGQMSQVHLYITDSIINREGTFIKAKWLLR